MSTQSRHLSIPWWGFLFALGGLVWCGWVAFPTGHPSPCFSSGCSLFRDGRMGAVSLWWVGGACFFVLALLCLRGKRRAAYLLASLALFLDALLLLVMFFTAPCLDCLIVAAFFGLSCFALRPLPDGWFGAVPGRMILLPIWCGLFLANLAAVGNEALPRWAVANAGNTSMRIYFAPSCEHCRAALMAWGHTAALYPVAETDDDADAVLKLEALLLKGVPMAEALERCRNPEEPLPPSAPFTRTLLSIRMLRNKAAVLKQGFQALPLIEINGMPSLPKAADIPARRETHPTPSPDSSGSSSQGAGGLISPRGNGTTPAEDSSTPWDTGALGQCGRGDAPPCN